MRHTRYRRLDQLIIGAAPEKLASAPRVQVTVPVEFGRSRWKASSGQVNATLAKARQLGGAIEGQRLNGDWERICQYFTKQNVPYGRSESSGQWFQVQALREVL